MTTLRKAERGSLTGSPAIRIGARKSRLAQAQAQWVADRLAEHGCDTVLVGITTTGDTDRRQLTEIGGSGVFASAVRDDLLAGRIDLAVHSLKDLPTAPAPGLRLTAIPVREDVRDVLVGTNLDSVSNGARIGTGSPRRAVQLQALAAERRISIEVVAVRGNVDTRLGLVRDGLLDGIVLAAAGLRRLGYLVGGPLSGGGRVEVSGLTAELLAKKVWLPAAGQGALALETSERGDYGISAAVAQLDDPVARAETLAERAFLATLEAGCLAPVGATADVKSVHGTSADLTIGGVIGTTLESNVVQRVNMPPLIRVQTAGPASQAATLGRDLARRALARLADSQRSTTDEQDSCRSQQLKSKKN